METNSVFRNRSCSLLIIIVNRGKGSKVLHFARDKGASDASCFLGKGTIKNKWLELLEMDEVEKEIVMVVVPSKKEEHILREFNNKFHFERLNHGIAFTIPLVGVLKMKRDKNVNWCTSDAGGETQQGHTALLAIVDKGKGDKVVEISHDIGYYGGTIIKAHGSANNSNIVLDMFVEPEKEVVLMLMKDDEANHLSEVLKEQLHFDKPNTGMVVKVRVSKTMGLHVQKGQDREVGR